MRNNNNNNNNSGRGGWRGNNNNNRYNNNNTTNNTNNNRTTNSSGGGNPFATTTTTTTTSQQQSSASALHSRGMNNFNRPTNNPPSSSNPFSRQQQTTTDNNNQQYQQAQPQPSFGNTNNATSRNPFASSGSASMPINQKSTVMMTTQNTNHSHIGNVFNKGELGGTINNHFSGNPSGFNSQPFSGSHGYPMSSSSHQANKGNNPFALSGAGNPPPSNAFGSAFGTNTAGSSSGGGFGSQPNPAPISAEMRSALKSLDLKDALEGQANNDDVALTDMLPTSGEGDESQSSLSATTAVQGINAEEVIKKHHEAISQFEKWLERSHPELSQAVKPMRDEVAKVKSFDLIAKNHSQWRFVAGRLPSYVPSS